MNVIVLHELKPRTLGFNKRKSRAFNINIRTAGSEGAEGPIYPNKSRRVFNSILRVTLTTPLVTSTVKTHHPSICLLSPHLALRKVLRVFSIRFDFAGSSSRFRGFYYVYSLPLLAQKPIG